MEKTMKIYISADIEGIAGVTHWDETELQHADSQVAREQMTAEVAAACEGAIYAGAVEIWVKDSHDSARNLLADRLPQEARLIRGWSGHPFLTLQELDKTFQAVALIGYHSRAGAGTSPLAHTYTGKVTTIKLNDREVSEFLMDAYTAAYVGVPLIFISGDQGICDEAVSFDPHIHAVAVKQGVGNSTINLHPDLAAARIREGISQALRSDALNHQISLPAHFLVEVHYRTAYNAYHNGFYPGAKQTDALTVRFETDNYFDVLRFLMFTVLA
jgi:D-amino peptidase